MNAENLKEYEGGCACGAVRFVLRHKGGGVSFCHCRMCQQWCGGMPLANLNGIVKLTAEDSLRWWKSSPWGERGFCTACGSSLFWRAIGGEECGVSAGALDGAPPLTADSHIFIDEAASYYQFSDALPKHNGAEHTAFVLLQLSEKIGADFLPKAIADLRQHNGDDFADKVQKLTQS